VDSEFLDSMSYFQLYRKQHVRPTTEKLTVLIVGCGNIAGRFDEQRSVDALPFTHVGAYCRDGRFEVQACVEPDTHRQQEFRQYWHIAQGFTTLAEVLALGQTYDVISICSPSAAHFQDLQLAIKLRPQLIFCEKPVTYSIAETEQIIAECAALNILLQVNYTRAWDPACIKLKAEYVAGKWGKLRSITGLYNKGILNNGSHMLDLLYALLGEMKLQCVGRPVYDFFTDDPTIPVFLQGPQALPIQIAISHAADYAVFELQLVFEQGIIVMEAGGFNWRERGVEDNQEMAGYRKLKESVFREGEYQQAMLNAVANIYNAINKGTTLAKTGSDALKVQRLCERIKQDALQSGG
jgi:predicted dehydrogenase